MNKLINYSFLSTLLLLSITFRISPTYVGGGDSWGMCTYILSINDNGNLSWILHNPMSYVGLFPYSYPSGGMVYVATFQLLTDLNILQTIELYSFMTSFLGILGAFLLLRQIHTNQKVVLLSVAFYSTYIWFVLNTWNRIGMRSLFVVIYPIALFILLRMQQTSEARIRWALISVLLSVILLSVHRLFLFYGFLVILPFAFIRIGVLLNSIFYLDNRLSKYGIDARKHTIYSVYILSILFLLLESFGIQIYGTNDELTFSLREGRQHNFLGEGTFLHALINLSLDFAAYYTVAVFIIFFGIIHIMLTKYHLNKNLYFVISIIFSIPFIYDIKYFLSFAGPLSIIFLSFGLKLFYEKFRDEKVLFEFAFYTCYLFALCVVGLHAHNKNSDPLLIFIILGISISIFFRNINMRGSDFSKRRFWTLAIGLLLISISQTLIVTVYHSENYMESDERTEDVNLLPSYWMRENGVKNWISYRVDTDLKISTLSKENMLGNKYAYYDNKELYEMILNAELNITRTLNGFQYAYDYDYSYRYEEEFLGFNVIERNDQLVIDSNDVQYMLLTNDQIENEGVDGFYFASVPFLKEEKYVIYHSPDYIIYSN